MPPLRRKSSQPKRSAPRPKTSPKGLVHRLALVEKGARLGKGVQIGPFAFVESGARIGDGSRIHAHATVRRSTSLGPQNEVHEGAVLGGDPQDLAFQEAETFLEIGAGNRIREGVTIHRGTAPGSTTRVGSECFLMAYSHVAHNCTLGNRVILANNVALAGHVEIQDRAFLSGGVVVHQFCRIGRLSMVGGNAKIIKDCLPFVVTDGVPGRASGLNVVGLRRAGIGASDLRTLKEAYRLLLREALPLAEALERIEGLSHPLASELAAFARSSARGFSRSSPE